MSTTRESPFASPEFDLRRAVACLALEVPGEVWDDVNAKVEAVLDAYAELRAAALPLARLPHPVSSDERVQWLTRQQKLREVLGE